MDGAVAKTKKDTEDTKEVSEDVEKIAKAVIENPSTLSVFKRLANFFLGYQREENRHTEELEKNRAKNLERLREREREVERMCADDVADHRRELAMRNEQMLRYQEETARQIASDQASWFGAWGGGGQVPNRSLRGPAGTGGAYALTWPGSHTGEDSQK